MSHTQLQEKSVNCNFKQRKANVTTISSLTQTTGHYFEVRLLLIIVINIIDNLDIILADYDIIIFVDKCMNLRQGKLHFVLIVLSSPNNIIVKINMFTFLIDHCDTEILKSTCLLNQLNLLQYYHNCTSQITTTPA